MVRRTQASILSPDKNNMTNPISKLVRDKMKIGEMENITIVFS